MNNMEGNPPLPLPRRGAVTRSKIQELQQSSDSSRKKYQMGMDLN